MLPAHRAATVESLLRSSRGVVTSAALTAAGLTTKDIYRLTTAGRLVRLRRGVLVDGALWGASAPWDRHAIRARAFAADLLPSGQDRLAVSHQSALALMELAVHGVDDAVHLSRVGTGKSYRSTGLHVHGPVDGEHTVTIDGTLVVTPQLACLQVAAASGVESGLVAADSALRAGACTRDDLTALVGLPTLRTGHPSVRLVTRLADGRRESAGESRTAWLLHQLPVPPPVPQVVIRHGGAVVARVDFLLEGTRVVVEFDGMLKYSAVRDVHAEKRREDALRTLGYEVVRLTWDDLARPEVVLRKVRAALDRAALRVAS
ncbi:type IV toxin-antitoxin system AbiEi family antitoxin domain-containing protein [Ornithinimicrobium pekingense]|uniref:DUF559 domain-containing protein n=1 Tax=Ornithinimicrobium pekingense TaxID=384677 RepID=A0ABQ2F6G7_9MICO|nr:type IV toxin-antitoxin system AbiEi family antitoxin domain-containing protein [Ornithinimicrobium pekingense]GGK66760.1 hypothetical protein GCM10011509_13860 [Ornithinimicrobium pekingense]